MLLLNVVSDSIAGSCVDYSLSTINRHQPSVLLRIDPIDERDVDAVRHQDSLIIDFFQETSLHNLQVLLKIAFDLNVFKVKPSSSSGSSR